VPTPSGLPTHLPSPLIQSKSLSDHLSASSEHPDNDSFPLLIATHLTAETIAWKSTTVQPPHNWCRHTQNIREVNYTHRNYTKGHTASK